MRHARATCADAGLQLRIASIVEAQATRASGKAAAVVLDPDTGAVLASVSYPWPSADADDERERDVDPLLDRARYGLYPPGSTFKLVTAAAALDRDLDLARTVFSCARLEDGRIGAKLAGWSRPVRDDVLDTHPHGSIDMHEAVVHSCNAYFAQLAVKLGPQALMDCAARPASPTPRRQRACAAAAGRAAGDVPSRRCGWLAPPRWQHRTLRDEVGPGEVPKTSAFLSPAASHLLAGYLRDVVTSGTGRSLRNHPWRIAGKTGTAEVSGAPSHGWFVGYAPYGPARKRIAFAIVIEHGGYGGRSAAPAAGEIVSAAALSGLIE